MWKKKKPQILLTVLICLLSVCFYFNTGYYIKKHGWKHGRKSSVGDWIEFNSPLYSLEGRTLYKNGVPVGKVIFCFERYLFVYVNDAKGMGYYYKKK
jgi:hypothetical protein